MRNGDDDYLKKNLLQKCFGRGQLIDVDYHQIVGTLWKLGGAEINWIFYNPVHDTLIVATTFYPKLNAFILMLCSYRKGTRTQKEKKNNIPIVGINRRSVHDVSAIRPD